MTGPTVVTPRMIIEYAIAAGVATWHGEPMCTHGHVVTDVNVVMEKGKKRCRTCKRERDLRYRQARRKRERNQQ